MNDAYAGMGISFTLVSTDFTTNNAWAAANIGTAAERNMKTALKKGTYGELDLYFTTDIPNRTLGWYVLPPSPKRTTGINNHQVLLSNLQPLLPTTHPRRLRQPRRLHARRYRHAH